jgi:hypothetical protein
VNCSHCCLRLLQVGDALLDVIFDPDVADGAGLVIDGFPRTALQVEQLIPTANTQILQQCSH